MPRSCEAAHEDSKVKAQEGGEIHHIATDHGPMVQDGLLTAHPGGVHGYGRSLGGGVSFWQGAGAASPGSPDLETTAAAEQRGFREKGSVLGVSTPRGKYRRRGEPRGPTRQSGGSLARPRVGPRQQPSWLPGGGPPSFLDDSGRFRHTDF